MGHLHLKNYWFNGKNYPYPCKPHVDYTILGQKRFQTDFWTLSSRVRYVTETQVWDDIAKKKYMMNLKKLFGNPLKDFIT